MKEMYPGSTPNAEGETTEVSKNENGLVGVHKEASGSEVLEIYGEFCENGYVVQVLLPEDASQEQQWTVRFFTEDGQLAREVTIPLMYEPIFGVDVDDVITLETQVDEILRELASLGVRHHRD